MTAQRSILATTVILSLTFALLASATAPAPASAQPGGRTSLISYAPAKLPTARTPNRSYTQSWSAGFPAISADGKRIAFATNLSLTPDDASSTAQDTNSIGDIYVFDRIAGQHILASPTYTGTAAAGVNPVAPTDVARIAPNGQYVAFATASNRLVSGDNNQHYDAFVFEMIGTTRLMRIASAVDADGDSLQPDVSDDGTVAFSSYATNLIRDPKDTNGSADIFVRKLDGTMIRATVASDGGQANGGSSVAAISRDGKWVAFTSRASNLVENDQNGAADVFVRDLVNNLTYRASVSTSGTEGNGESRLPDVAVNGDEVRVIFQSSATNLVPDDTNGVDDIFVYTLNTSAKTHTTVRASVSSAGAQGDHAAGGPSIYYWPSITSDGRFVVFPSSATNLVDGDTNNASDVFIRDLGNSTTARVSVGPDGNSLGSGYGTAADGGQLIAFQSSGALSPMAPHISPAIFLRDRQGDDTRPSVQIDPGLPTEILKTSAAPLMLRGTATLHPNDSGGSIAGYAWSSSLDGVIAQAEDIDLSPGTLTAGIHQIIFVAINSRGEARASSPHQVKVTDPTQKEVQTLILANTTRIGQLYPNDPAVGALGARLKILADSPAVNGEILDVNTSATTREAYATWFASPTTANANLVAEAIKGQIDQYWRTHTGLQYLVIVGDDRVIPFRRVPDRLPDAMNSYPPAQKRWLEEQEYAAMVDLPATTTLGSALNDNQILTDDYYGYNKLRYSWGTEQVPRYYVPDLGIGRLVEQPAEILAQINTFLAGSSVTVDQAGISAWGLDSEQAEMLADGGWGASSTLASDGISADAALVGLPVSAPSWAGRFLASGVRNDILAFHHHANHTGFTPGDDDSSVSINSFYSAGADLSRAMLYSDGCHIGLSVPPDNPPYDSDLAESITGRDAVYLGSTGYGIACTRSTCKTEELLADFTTALVAGQSATPGQALASAKARYQRDTFTVANYIADQESDEKASLQLALYGLPMYRYVTPGGATAADLAGDGVAVTMTSATLDGSLTVNSFGYQFPPLDEVQAPGGRYYTFQGETIASQAQPLQPRYTADLSFPGTRAHGVVFRGGSYSSLAGFDPAVAALVNQYVSADEPSLSGASWRPSLPVRLNTLADAATMVAALGQYQASTQTERIFQRLALDIYYHPDSTDWEAPTITLLRSIRSGSQANVTVHATDLSGIAAVVVAYTDGGGTWESVALKAGDSAWAGTIPATDSTQLFVQAVDGAGNVATLDNRGEYYQTTDIASAPLSTHLPLLAR